MFKATWKLGTADYTLIKQIKTEVFIDELSLPEKFVFDNRDATSAHLLVVEEETGKPMVTARIYPLGKNTHIGEIAVMKEFRSQDYADFALRMLLYKAQQLSGQNIVADVLESELDLYKSFGFSEVEPDLNCEHDHCHCSSTENKSKSEIAQRNILHLSVPTDKVLWHSQCKE